jgi:outer membrane protein OmpA-like peptidoglycan-associated protein
MCAGLRTFDFPLPGLLGDELAETATATLYNLAEFLLNFFSSFLRNMMSSQDDDGQQGLVLGVVFGLVALVLTLVIGLGIYKKNMPTAAARPKAVATAPTAVDAASAAQAASDAASVKVENGIVKFYFASGKSELAAGASDALAGLIKDANSGATTGRKLVISGFHDATGDAAKNAELAKLRAMAVRDALKTAGVSEQQIELNKPQQMAGSGSNAEARRVEVSLQ